MRRIAAPAEGDMGWFPVGPDFVFAPRDASFKRLSRHNEGGTQGMVWFIAVDPTDPNTIYTVDRPSPNGHGIFRTRDGGSSWDSIVDPLSETNPFFAPQVLAVHPRTPSTIFLGADAAGTSGLFLSHDRGDTWQAAAGAGLTGGSVTRIAVDPR